MTEIIENVSEPALYSETEAELSNLRELVKSTVFEIQTQKGLKTATDLRAKVRNIRTGIEKNRKALKQPVIELGKRIDSEAARITTELLELETPLNEQIKAEENRKEAIKQAEQNRVSKVNELFEHIKSLPLCCIGKPLAFIQGIRFGMNEITLDKDVLIDRYEEALDVIGNVSSTIDDMALDAERKEIVEKELEQMKADKAYLEDWDIALAENQDRSVSIEVIDTPVDALIETAMAIVNIVPLNSVPNFEDYDSKENLEDYHWKKLIELGSKYAVPQPIDKVAPSLNEDTETVLFHSEDYGWIEGRLCGVNYENCETINGELLSGATHWMPVNTNFNFSTDQ